MKIKVFKKIIIVVLISILMFSNLGTTYAHVHTPGAAATCTTAQVCTSCGITLVSAIGHSPGSAATCTTAQICIRCGYGYVFQPALGHTFTSYFVTTVATCTSSGIKTATCVRCSALNTMSYNDFDNHNFGSWIFQYTYYDNEEMTYVNVYKRTCSRCGYYEYEYI